MSNVTPITPRAPNTAIANTGLAPRDLALIRRTVAKDTNDDEFDTFIGYCKALHLDPRRRQIYAFVYSKDNAKKRKMTIVVGIDGLRAIADRTGCYRPDDQPAQLETDPQLRGPSNPAGLISATVNVYKFSHGEWHRVSATAYWEEFAPIKEEWSESKRVQDGEWPDGNPRYKEVPTQGAVKVATLDTSGQWGKMPRVMLAKVAEAAALRKAWPDDFSGVYTEEETDRSKVLDLTPSEAVEKGMIEDRLALIGGADGILFDWMDDKPLENTPIGKIYDRGVQFIKANQEEPSQLILWRTKNKHPLNEFWSRSKSDALELKKYLETAIERAMKAGEQ